MSKETRRRNLVLAAVALIGAALLLLVRCSRTPAAVGEDAAVAVGASAPAQASEVAKGAAVVEDVLTPATLEAPKEVAAGAVFSVVWSGPDNAQDFITIVKPGAADAAYSNYGDTKNGRPLSLTAPIEAGVWELRYVTARSRTVLARRPITVAAMQATLDAAEEAVLGAELSVRWTGPNNAQDYLTIVAKDAPDGRYGNYAETKEGSPLTLTVPPEAGEAELRYMTGQGAKVLARRSLRIVAPEVRLSAPGEVIAGAVVTVEWEGPNHRGDYITLVAKETKDGQYGNYTDANKGSPLTVTAPITPGEAELRYMSGQGAKVLGRRAIRVVAAEVSLTAPSEVKAGTTVSVEWTGPNNTGDYVTLVPRGMEDGRYGNYADARNGSPLTIAVPKETGEAELRYMSGQGAKVLARRAVRIVK